MSDQILERANRTFDAQPLLPWLAAAAVYVPLIICAPRLLADPDSYSHVALGRWILEHGAVPTGDPLSQTMRGEPWIAFEWLSQVVYAVAYEMDGWIAVVLLAAAAVAVAFGVLTRFLLRVWPPIAVLAGFLVALVLLSPHILTRPHVLALPLMVAWVACLVRTVDTAGKPPFWLLPIMTLWANLHGSFTFGIAIIAPIACEAVWNAAPQERRQEARRWFLFGVGALAAACLNPYGPKMILVTFRTIALGDALDTITEWRPQDFSHPGAFEAIMLAGFGLALYRGIKLPPLRIIVTLGLLHLSLSQCRHADLLGMLAPIFLAQPLAAQFGRAGLATITARVGAWLPAVVALAVVAATAISTQREIAPPADITPAKALQAVDLAKAGPLLNDYNFGAYLDFVGVPPFIDGRTELYGREFTLRHARALSLQDLPGLLRLLDEYRIRVTLLSPRTPAVALLDRLPEWQRVYADDVAVVHMRRDPAPAPAD